MKTFRKPPKLTFTLQVLFEPTVIYLTKKAYDNEIAFIYTV